MDANVGVAVLLRFCGVESTTSPVFADAVIWFVVPVMEDTLDDAGVLSIRLTILLIICLNELATLYARLFRNLTNTSKKIHEFFITKGREWQCGCHKYGHRW